MAETDGADSIERRVARVRAVFDEWAQGDRADRMADSHWPVARRALERLALARDARFLDIGCGNGSAVRWAAAAAPGGRVVGIDVSPEMIALAKRLSARLPNTEFRVAMFGARGGLAGLAPDGTGNPVGLFDAIFSMEVFYYLPDLDAALGETLDLLVPGGRFACAVDFYGENVASHSWPDDLGVEMTLLDQAGWQAAFERAGFVHVSQERIRQPEPAESDGPPDWKVTHGTLLTMGERP
ncbi:MAG: class I SAM-dependent methyltransferase [Gemmatimonadota bacterium]|nr:class I SAM-dependent methyltransferase [Gemmatimonadota bacterium]